MKREYNISKIEDHAFLNVVDERASFFENENKRKHDTIFFLKDSLHHTKDGFTYNYHISLGNGYFLAGAGIVVNREYLGKSESEIRLMCDIENPVSSEDIEGYLDHMQISGALREKIKNFASTNI